MRIDFELNGEAVTVEGANPADSLLETLRERFGLTGARPGCLTGDCGCCNVHVDGRVVPACLMLTPMVQGRAVTTVEGLAVGEELTPVQQAFHDHYAAQCGYCTSGQVMAATDLLAQCPQPTLDDAQRGMAGNLCRCTGYRKILEAVMAASGNGHYANEGTE